MSRGVQQGDLLSPLLFGIPEDYVSWSLTNLVAAKVISPIDSS